MPLVILKLTVSNWFNPIYIQVDLDSKTGHYDCHQSWLLYPNKEAIITSINK